MTISDQLKHRARTLLTNFKGDSYAFGVETIGETGKFAAELGQSALVIANRSAWLAPVLDRVMDSLRRSWGKSSGRGCGSRVSA
jgi:hypothetical protein